MKLKLKNTILGAAILTITAGSYASYLLIHDPVVTPLRVTGAVLVATGLGGVWGRVIWDRHHQ